MTEESLGSDDETINCHKLPWRSEGILAYSEVNFKQIQLSYI